jgi:hypothetical protein
MTRYIWTTVSFSKKTSPLRLATPRDRGVAAQFGVWLKVSAVQKPGTAYRRGVKCGTRRARSGGPLIG